MITLGDNAAFLLLALVSATCGGELMLGELVELRKILAYCFKAVAISFLSRRTVGMLFSRNLFSLMATSRISSWGVFWVMFILCGKNHTGFAILSTLVVGT